MRVRTVTWVVTWVSLVVTAPSVQGERAGRLLRGGVQVRGGLATLQRESTLQRELSEEDPDEDEDDDDEEEEDDEDKDDDDEGEEDDEDKDDDDEGEEDDEDGKEEDDEDGKEEDPEENEDAHKEEKAHTESSTQNNPSWLSHAGTFFARSRVFFKISPTPLQATTGLFIVAGLAPCCLLLAQYALRRRAKGKSLDNEPLLVEMEMRQHAEDEKQKRVC